LLITRLYGGRTKLDALSSGARIAGAWPSALIARIWIGVMLESACLPSVIAAEIEISRSAGSTKSVPSAHITDPTALPPSVEARCDSLALRPTGTMATSGASGSASSSSR
jgi:hypothetical protein